MPAQIDAWMWRLRRGKVPGRIIAWALIEGRPLTTRGRWINPLVFALFHAAQILPAPVRAGPPIFIIGTGRSGTTVLGKLFALHRETVFLNEPKAMWHFAHGGEDIIGSYSRARARIRLGPADAAPAIARRIAQTQAWALAWGRGRRIVDKYPELVFRTGFARALFPQARFIAILRDGVDTCASVTGWSGRKGATVGQNRHDWWGRAGRKWQMIVDQIVPEHPDLAPLQPLLRATTDHRDRAAVEWIVSMREARRAAAEDPDTLAIRYEDLCASPAQVIARMLDHCALPPDPVMLDYARTILSPTRPHGDLDLMPALVAPFTETLSQMGYDQSIGRVRPRAGG